MATTTKKPSKLATMISMAFFAMLCVASFGVSAYLFWLDNQIYVTGEEANATIQRKWTRIRHTPEGREPMAHNITHVMRYTFRTIDGGAADGTQIVSKSFYERFEVGDNVTVRYAADNPAISQIDRVSGSIGMYVSLAIGLLLAAGLIYSVRFDMKQKEIERATA